MMTETMSIDCFAIIPTLGVGGPLAVLAVLFPALFGGLLVLFRQWAAFFTVVSGCFTLWLLHGWLRDDYLGAWWTTDHALWFAMFLLAVVGVFWAWRRHLQPEKRPEITERIVLAVLAVACVVGFFLWEGTNLRLFDVRGDFLVAFSVAIWFGASVKIISLLARVVSTKSRAANHEPIRFPTEGWLLAALLMTMTVLTAVRPRVTQVLTQADVVGETDVALAFTQIQKFGPGAIWSSPVVDGDRIYLSMANNLAGVGAGEDFGAVVCYNWRSGKLIWQFSDGFRMKPVFCSPCLANGRVYIGEGLHHHKNCNLYCLDAKTGKEVGRFGTKSHTESTPVYADGRVYFGAGDDGVYCIDQFAREKIWQFQHPQHEKRALHLHVDSDLAISKKCVYGSGGFDADIGFGDPAMFCLNVKDGKPIWLRRTPKWMIRIGDKGGEKTHVPAWGGPVVHRGQVFFGVGNGRVGMDSTLYEPVGALIGLDAQTGKDLWPPFRVSNGVLRRPVVDEARVFFGCRDGFVYCIGRDDGKLRWKRDMGFDMLGKQAAVESPVTLDQLQVGTHANAVIVVASNGKVSCLDPQTGEPYWNKAVFSEYQPTVSSRPVLHLQRRPNGVHRHIFFGMGLYDDTAAVWVRLTDMYVQ